ncbi:SpoIIE family protein phosphatase [Bacteriovoracaceae bacterium]|nr:SpoIIE family protein phosphatase [Bacteriovoracaceae bacterium]
MKTKFILISLFFCLCLSGIQIFFNLKTIEKDKSAYLIEQTQGYIDQFALLIESEKRELSQVANTLVLLAEDQKINQLSSYLSEKILSDYGFAIYLKQNDGTYNIYQKKILTNDNFVSSISSIQFEKTYSKLVSKIIPNSRNKFFLQSFFQSEGREFFIIVEKQIENFAQRLKFSNAISLFFTNPEQNLYLQFTGELKKSLFRKSLSQLKIDKSFSSRVTIKGIEYLYSANILPSLNGSLVGMIEYELLLSSFHELIINTIGLNIIFLGILILVVSLLSNKFVNPILQLKEQAVEISSGNFEKRTDIKSNDELGELSVSVNTMASKLVELIESEKDKIRLEKEVEIASSIQEKFFPPEDLLNTGSLEIFGLYRSASECGGDWWGLNQIDGKTIFMIGDATGHGVGAAFITATTYCLNKMLPALDIRDEKGEVSTNKILKEFNQVVFNLGGEICMTFFVGCFDPQTNVVTYSNASHNPPILCKPEHKRFKELEFLMDANGVRLGQRAKSEYISKSFKLEKGQQITLYSDGLTENPNRDGDVMGEVNLARHLIKNKDLNGKHLAEYLLDATKLNDESLALEDDVTFLHIKAL